MEKRTVIQKTVSAVVFVALVIGIFYLCQKKITQNKIHCAIVSIAAAMLVSYIQSKLISNAMDRAESIKNEKIEANSLRARQKRQEEKVQKLTKELEAASLKLKTEIADKPLDQRHMQQRLKNLNCLYALSKIVNKQGTSLEQIFQKTVDLIRQTYRYPEATSVRIIFDGVRYQTDDFQKTESSRQVQIKAQQKDAGAIEIYHKGEKAEDIEYPVLTEEEGSLLSAVAEWLGSLAERREAEDKMRLFRNLIERSNDCIFLIEPKWGRFLDVNCKACDSLGYTQKEFINEVTVKNIDESIPDDNVWQRQIEALRQKGDVVKEATYKKKDGEKFFVETSLKFVTQEKEDYIIAIARDVSERKRSEAKLKAAQEKLLDTARQVGMAEVATGVLHNVGNVLNSVSVTAESIQKRIRKSKVSYLSDAVHLFEEHTNDLPAFLENEERGKKLPLFLANLSQELIEEQSKQLESLGELTRHVQHVADIIQVQQSYSKTKGLTEPASITELIDDSVKINSEAILRNHIEVKRKYADLPSMLLDRHKVLQILTNLISNAIYALAKSANEEKILTLNVHESRSKYIKIEVSDNGIGIPLDNITRIFEHGFTTKEKGHGFGLHSTALSINELNGSIAVYSDGPGKGSLFSIELPFTTQETTT